MIIFELIVNNIYIYMCIYACVVVVCVRDGVCMCVRMYVHVKIVNGIFQY